MRAVFLDTATLGFTPDLLKELPLQWSFFEKTKPEEVVQRIGDAAIVATNKVLLTKEILQKCPNLKLICIVATGYNNVDLAVAKALGIKMGEPLFKIRDLVAKNNVHVLCRANAGFKVHNTALNILNMVLQMCNIVEKTG